MIRRAILTAALALALAVVPAAVSARPPEAGEAAPEATMTLANGSQVKLGDLRGQVVVLNFWATWCGPCKKELPLLDAYYALQKAHGLRVFAATTEDSLPARTLHALFGKLAIDAVVRLKGPYEPLKGVPTNFVIDRTGVVRYAKAGAWDLAALNAILVPLLEEPAPSPAHTVGA